MSATEPSDPAVQCSHREEVATGEIYFCIREARHVGFHRYYDLGCANTDSCQASVHVLGCPVAAASECCGACEVDECKVAAPVPAVEGLTEAEKFALGKALYVAIERTQWADDVHPIIPAVERIVAERVATAKAEGILSGGYSKAAIDRAFETGKATSERDLVERIEAVLRVALNLLDRQTVTKDQDTHSDGMADGIAAVVEPLVKTLGYANTGRWLRTREAKRCDDDLHEHTLIHGVVVCRECWGFPEQPAALTADARAALGDGR